MISSQTNVLCNGNATGSATIMGMGAGTFMYSWAPSGGTSATASGLAAGTYTCTITSDCGGMSSSTVSITQPTAISSSTTQVDVMCNGASTGSIDLTVTGGVGPYTFDWNSGMYTTEDLSGIPAGSYVGVLTDANGCTDGGTVTINEPTAINVTSTTVNVSCNGGNDGSVDLTVTGGVGPYTFDWNSGMFTTEDISGLIAGSYTGTLTDANGCTASGTMTVSEPAMLVASIFLATDPTTCGGSDGAITITLSGGTTPYAYMWSNSATTQNIMGLTAGTYNCDISDANGCVTFVSATLADPAPPVVTFALTQTTICLNDASMTLPAGSPAGGTYSGTGVSGNMFNPMTAGNGTFNITYTFTDPNTQCTGTDVDAVTVSACTGIASQVNANGFEIYPNPNNGQFTFMLTNKVQADVLIYNAEGQLVNSFHVNAGIQKQIRLDVSGVYTITVVDEKGNRSSERVVVTR